MEEGHSAGAVMAGSGAKKLRGRSLETASNRGLRLTADTTAVIISEGAGRRVMPGVSRLLKLPSQF